MPITKIVTPQAPQALGPYSQAVAGAGLIFTSGQIGIDPATGSLVQGGIEAETRRALENLKAILEAAGSGLSAVLKTTVYLADIAEFQAMNRVYEDLFAGHAPARATLQAAKLPKQARVEIEAVALGD